MIESLLQSKETKRLWSLLPEITTGKPGKIDRRQHLQILWQFRQDELDNYITNITTPLPENQTRVIIFGQGRSGTTLLESLLCSGEHFERNGELLSPYYKSRARYGIKLYQGEALLPSYYIHGLLKKQTQNNFLFHLKIYHLTGERHWPVNPKRVLRTFYRHGWKIIYLRRTNRIKHVLSNWVRNHRGSPEKKNDNQERHRLHVDCDLFAEMIRRREIFETMERDCLQSMDFHEVVYDDDLENADCHQRTLDGVFQFLDLPSASVSTSYRKVNTQSMEDLIINYDEFRECMLANGWGHFLDEQAG